MKGLHVLIFFFYYFLFWPLGSSSSSWVVLSFRIDTHAIINLFFLPSSTLNLPSSSIERCWCVIHSRAHISPCLVRLLDVVYSTVKPLGKEHDSLISSLSHHFHRFMFRWSQKKRGKKNGRVFVCTMYVFLFFLDCTHYISKHIYIRAAKADIYLSTLYSSN